ncbi:MAG TPA: MerR family transcriptional regulator [Actinomycetota bacterium]|nr:MerR family transcriptional regulator [Actinomycetota bacterium]
MITSAAVHAISGPKAAELANITYRQLDYWARQGWVTPSVEAGTGRPGRRIYDPDDVVKLAALGHFGRSGADVGQLGPGICRLDLPDAADDYLLVSSGGAEIEIVGAAGLRKRVSSPGPVFVFDPQPLLRRITSRPDAAGGAARRTA